MFKCKGSSRWTAQAYIWGKQTTLGTFSDEEEAARCYDDSVKEQFGASAVTNFIDGIWRTVDRIKYQVDKWSVSYDSIFTETATL